MRWTGRDVFIDINPFTENHVWSIAALGEPGHGLILSLSGYHPYWLLTGIHFGGLKDI